MSSHNLVGIAMSSLTDRTEAQASLIPEGWEPIKRGTTQAAEGMQRLAFTVDDVYRMVEVGLLHEDDHVELIDGELVPMHAKGNHHEVLKIRLTRHFGRVLADDYIFATETSYRLSKNTLLEPDFVFYPEAQPLRDLRGDNTLLVIEIADSSLWYDKGCKANIYASFGVPELWVMHAVHLKTLVFRDPLDGEYQTRFSLEPQEEAIPSLIPGLKVQLSTLTLR